MSASPKENSLPRALGQLAGSDLAELMAIAEPFEIADGVLFRQGDVADTMYVLEDGEIEILARTPGDDLVALGVAGGGAVLGELSLIDDGVRSATARVAKPASGWSLSRRAFQMLRAARRPASAALLSHLSSLTCQRIRARVIDLAKTLDRAPLPVFIVPADVTRERWTSIPAMAVDPRTASLLPFFRELSNEERATLFGCGAAYSVPRGERLALAGAMTHSTLVVVRGAAALSIERDGRRERCGLAPPGRIASVVASMDGGELALGAAAREETVILVLERDVLAGLRAAKNDLAFKLEDALVNELVHELRLVTGQVSRLAAHGRAHSHS